MPLLPEIRQTSAKGFLSGLPILHPTTAMLQLLTGLGPGSTGIFDTVYPDAYSVQRYSISEQINEHLICDRVNAHGLTCSCDHFDASRDVWPDLTLLANVKGQELDRLVTIARQNELTTFIVVPCSRLRATHSVNLNDFFKAIGVLETYPNGQINWSETLAYHVGHGQIWINLIGREPDGIVLPGTEYEELRTALQHILLQAHDSSTQKSLTEHVYFKEDIYHEESDYFAHAPDLVVAYSNGFTPSQSSLLLQLDGRPTKVLAKDGYSYGPGQFIAFGPGIHEQWSGKAKLVDITITIYALLGLPAEYPLDGSITSGLTAAEITQAASGAGKQHSDLSTEDEKRLAQRLQSLGYLE